MAFKSEKQHKENLRAMGRFGGLFFLYVTLLFGALWLGFQNLYGFAAFFIVLIAGGIFLVPRALKVMRAFEENVRK